MSKLNKSILREFKSSFPRFISITILLALGSAILIGLKVTGDDMRVTGNAYFEDHEMAHAKVTSTIDFTDDDKEHIDNMDHVDKTEYSIYRDARIQDSDKAIRLNENTTELSLYKVKEGRLPEESNEIALNAEDTSDYKVGETIKFTNSKNEKDVSGLEHHEYEIVGFVTSSDYMMKQNLDVTNVGTGQINTFGVLDKSGFSTSEPNVAKLTYDNVKGKSYSDRFENKINDNVSSNADDLEKWSDKRRTDLKDEKQEEIDDARKEIDKANKDIDKAKDSIATAKKDIDKAKKEINKQKDSVEENKAMLQQAGKLESTEKEIAEKEKEVKSKEKEISSKEKEIKDNEKDLKSKEKEIDSKEKDIDKLDAINYEIESRSDYNEGYNNFGESAERIDILSNTFPMIFFAVAILVTFITMSRMAEEKRMTMGVMRALGYSKYSSMKLFLIYGTSAALIGTAAGSYFGTVFLPKRIYEAYAANLVVPEIQTPIHWSWIIISLIIALLCTVAPSVYIAWKSLKEKPKYLLLPKPPKAGSKILLERVTFIWNRLSFNHKVTARNLFRYKGRMFMTIIGVFGCTSLLITGFGMKDSLNGIIDNQYKNIIHYDIISVYDTYASDDDKDNYEQKIDELDSIKEKDTIYYQSVTTKPKNVVENQQVEMVVPKNPNDFNNFMTLRDIDSGEKLKLSDDGVIISEKLSRLGEYKTGDTLKIKDNTNKEYEVKISGITEMYAGHHIVMNSAYYEKAIDKDLEYNANILNLKDRSDDNINKISTELNGEDASLTTIQSNQVKASINTILDGLDNIVLIIVVASSALSFVVLFTLTNINVSERTRELATLRVLGFYKNETVMYIYRETILLTIIGILTGFLGGAYLHHFIMDTLPPNNAMADMSLYWTNFTISTILTLIFAFIVMLIMVRKINNIDMLNALNSAD